VYVAATSGGQNYASPSYTSQPGATTLILTGLTPATRYYIVVRARDAAGNIDANTVERSVLTPVSPDTTPPAFGGLVSAAASGTTVTLSWNPATDNVGVTGYNVYAATVPGAQNFSVPTMTAPAGATSIGYPAPAGGITYYFVVRAVDTSGNIDGNTVERSATTDIFVNAASGNDSTGAGTAASPVRTIGHAIAVTAGKPGVTINAAAGTYDTALGEIFPLNFAGTAGRTLNCTPPTVTLPAVIPGTVITSSGSGQSAIFGGPGTTIRNCTVTGDSGTAGIYHNGGTITVQNCIIDGQGTTLNCLELGGTETVTGSTIRNCTQFGIVVSLAGSPTISGNVISGNGAGIRLWNTSSPLVSNNTIRSNTTGISSDTTGMATITGNSVHSNTGDGIVFNTPSGSAVLSNTVCGNGAMGINMNHSVATTVEPAVHNNRIFQNIGADLRTWAFLQVDATNNYWDNSPPTYGAGVCTGGVDTCSASFPALVNPYLGAVGTTVCP
jgi:parallel beta-helix repeat protein